jgi:hypothetical protein
MIKKAIRFTYPILIGGLLGTLKPEKANPSVAGTAINKPKAAAVPIALCIGTDKATSVGTPMVPAPTPIREDTKPIREDITIFNNLDFGRQLPSLKCSLKNIFKATKKAIDAKRYFNSFTLK